MGNLLSYVVFLPFCAALLLTAVPRREESLLRGGALIASLITFLVSLALLAGFDSGQGGMQMVVKVAWIESLGVSYHLGIDGITLPLVLLTTFVCPIVLLNAEGAITHKVKEFVLAILLLETAMLGTFLALDLFLFYVFWELMLIPMYLIIGVWGGPSRVYAAIKFFIYTMVGSVLMLVAILYLVWAHQKVTGTISFDLLDLLKMQLEPRAALLCFGAFTLAFIIKVPMFPLHTWLPDAHTEAPTPGSVILAAVLLKMGTYGFLRFSMGLFPGAMVTAGPALATLAVIGIIYGAMVSFAQGDMKKLIAYSSVSHLGFVMLGLLAVNDKGIAGGVMQMVGHGLSTGGLFVSVGVLYERRHTRQLDDFGGIWAQMPKYAFCFLVVMLASVGLPGLVGFVGEFLILAGAFTSYRPDLNPLGHPRLITGLASTGVILGAIYLLYMFQKVMFGPIKHPKNRELEDLSTREIWVYAPLMVMCFVLGMYPKPVLSRMQATVDRFLVDFKVKLDDSRTMAKGEAPRLMRGARAAAPTGAAALRGVQMRVKAPGGHDDHAGHGH